MQAGLPELSEVAEIQMFSTISVVGLGYIGLPTAVVLATKGIDVVGVDIDPDIVDAVRHGRVPFVEPELAVGVSDPGRRSGPASFRPERRGDQASKPFSHSSMSLPTSSLVRG